ncbi:MAG: hypothetical protein KBC35_02790 [Candidatus Pacebacteria bacterium]|nr:hypothetical protein [Candidatus Paceibacterota bacterium]
MKGVFTQFVMVVLSVGIIFTYIKPAFKEIAVIQSETKIYEEEITKVLSVNSQLSDLQADMESVSVTDKLRLRSYMPDSIDELMIMRDLYLITNKSGTLYKGVLASGNQGGAQKKKASTTSIDPNQHAFTLSAEGTYAQIKNLFSLLEKNNYPLEIQGVSLSPAEGGFLIASIDLVTYSFQDDITSQ